MFVCVGGGALRCATRTDANLLCQQLDRTVCPPLTQLVRVHKAAVERFTLRIQHCSAMVVRLCRQTSAGLTVPEQLATFEATLTSARAAIEVRVGRRPARRRPTRSTPLPSPSPRCAWALPCRARAVSMCGPCRLPRYCEQVFAGRGFLTRLLLAPSDLTRIQDLDNDLTQCLADMQVRDT